MAASSVRRMRSIVFLPKLIPSKSAETRHSRYSQHEGTLVAKLQRQARTYPPGVRRIFCHMPQAFKVVVGPSRDAIVADCAVKFSRAEILLPLYARRSTCQAEPFAIDIQKRQL